MEQSERLEKAVRQHLRQALDNLGKLCSYASVAVKKKYMNETAEYVKALLEEIGCEVRLASVPGANPVVIGRLKGTGNKTLLFYNHYDVQPPEPLDEWHTDPFRVEEKSGFLYGRGVSDNKSNILARILAVKAYRQVHGELPVNITFFVEGDEEIGSPQMEKILQENQEFLQADALIWEGGSKDLSGAPRLYYGSKGVLYLELEAVLTEKELHSSLAGILPNPATELINAIASLQDKSGNIAVEGFYDSVCPPGAEERQAAADLISMGESYRKNYKLDRFARGIKPEQVSYDVFFTPFVSIAGIVSGFVEEGMKQSVPVRACAKVEFSLVPRQSAADILQKVKNHLSKSGYDYIKINILGATDPCLTPMNHPFVKLTQALASKVYGQKPILYPTMLASGTYGLFCKYLKDLPMASIGVGHFHSNIHAPNENIRIEDFVEGAVYLAEIIKELPEALDDRR